MLSVKLFVTDFVLYHLLVTSFDSVLTCVTDFGKGMSVFGSLRRLVTEIGSSMRGFGSPKSFVTKTDSSVTGFGR